MNRITRIPRRQAGLTLIELLLVLVVVLAIAVVGFVTFGQTSANQRAQAGQQALLSVASGIKSLANGPNYIGITEQVLVTAGKAPSNLVNAAGNGINNPPDYPRFSATDTRALQSGVTARLGAPRWPRAKSSSRKA